MSKSDDLVIAYAKAAALCRERMPLFECDESEDFENNCLYDYFHAPRGPDDEFPRQQEFYDKMCPKCKARLELLDKRKQLRSNLAIIKRQITAHGKRLMKEMEATNV